MKAVRNDLWLCAQCACVITLFCFLFVNCSFSQPDWVFRLDQVSSDPIVIRSSWVNAIQSSQLNNLIRSKLDIFCIRSSLVGSDQIRLFAQPQLVLLNKRFGHLNFNVLMHLLKFYNCSKVSLQSLKYYVYSFCETCQLGKNHRLYFSITYTKTTYILEFIHTNL